MKYKYLFYIVLGLALGVFLVRGGAAILLPLLLPIVKLALPFVAAYFGYRFLRGKIRGLMQGDSPNLHRGNAIDLCPKCGDVLTDRHVCK